MLLSLVFLSKECSVAGCCGRPQRAGSCAGTLGAAAFSAERLCDEQGKWPRNDGFLTEDFKAEVEWKLCRLVWLRSYVGAMTRRDTVLWSV